MGDTTRTTTEQTAAPDDVLEWALAGGREDSEQRPTPLSSVQPGNPEAVRRQETCTHWWVVGLPITRYTGKELTGDLIEYTTQVCKKCDLERLNECLLAEPGVYDMAPKSGWSE